MFRRTKSRKGADGPPPPGQLTDPDYDEVSLVGHPANGEFFYVRKGENLSPKEIEELRQAGLAAPKTLTEVVKECVDAVLPEIIKKAMSKGDDAMQKKGTQKSGQETQPVQRELDSQEVEQIREIAQEVAGSLFDERFATIQEQIDALKAANEATTEEQTEMQKSIDSVKSAVTAVQGDVQKSLEFRPAGQGDGERGDPPLNPEDVQKNKSNKQWAEILSPKKGA